MIQVMDIVFSEWITINIHYIHQLLYLVHAHHAIKDNSTDIYHLCHQLHNQHS